MNDTNGTGRARAGRRTFAVERARRARAITTAGALAAMMLAAEPARAGDEGVAATSPRWQARAVGAAALFDRSERKAGDLIAIQPRGVVFAGAALAARVYGELWVEPSFGAQVAPSEWGPTFRLALRPYWRVPLVRRDAGAMLAGDVSIALRLGVEPYAVLAQGDVLAGVAPVVGLDAPWSFVDASYGFAQRPDDFYEPEYPGGWRVDPSGWSVALGPRVMF